MYVFCRLCISPMDIILPYSVNGNQRKVGMRAEIKSSHQSASGYVQGNCDLRSIVMDRALGQSLCYYHYAIPYTI